MEFHLSPLYRFTFLYLEPTFATAGSLQILFDPKRYLELGQPQTAPHWHPNLQPLFTTLAGGWLLLAFHDIFTLRLLDGNETAWRCVLAGGLISDILYVTCLGQDFGWAWFIRVDTWRGIDWFTVLSTMWPFGLKIFAMGLWVLEVVSNNDKTKIDAVGKQRTPAKARAKKA